MARLSGVSIASQPGRITVTPHSQPNRNRKGWNPAPCYCLRGNPRCIVQPAVLDSALPLARTALSRPGQGDAVFQRQAIPYGELHPHELRADPAGTTSDGKPIMQRSVSWHSAASVQLVAAYIVSVVRTGTGPPHFHVQRIATSGHSGQTTLITEPENPVIPEQQLLIEGRQT